MRILYKLNRKTTCGQICIDDNIINLSRKQNIFGAFLLFFIYKLKETPVIIKWHNHHATFELYVDLYVLNNMTQSLSYFLCAYDKLRIQYEIAGNLCSEIVNTNVIVGI